MFLRHSEDAELLSCLTLSDPMDVDHQAPLSMGFSMQEYQHGLLCPSPGDIPNPGIKPDMSPALVGRFFTTSATWEAHRNSSDVTNSVL